LFDDELGHLNAGRTWKPEDRMVMVTYYKHNCHLENEAVKAEIRHDNRIILWVKHRTRTFIPVLDGSDSGNILEQIIYHIINQVIPWIRQYLRAKGMSGAFVTRAMWHVNKITRYLGTKSQYR
jgi:hypothetical protein